MPPLVLTISPPAPLMAPEIVVLPEPASVSGLPPLLTLLETVKGLAELLVQLCEAPRARLAVLRVAPPEPLATLMPPAPIVKVLGPVMVGPPAPASIFSPLMLVSTPSVVVTPALPLRPEK